MHKKFEINQTKIKGGCQSGRKVAPHDSKSDLPLSILHNNNNAMSPRTCTQHNMDLNRKEGHKEQDAYV